MQFILFILFSIFLFSCSLEYEKEENPENQTPEFVFYNANYTKIENNKKKMKMNADQIEQYKSDSFSFISNARFTTFDKEEKEDTIGKCNLISADTTNEKYIMFGNIELNIISEKTNIFAEILNIDKKNEQITSDINKEVQIKKEDIDVKGCGFSSSGISKTYSFLSNSSGTMITKEENKEKTNESKN